MKADQEKELEYYRQQMMNQEAAWKKRLEEARREMEVSVVKPVFCGHRIGRPHYFTAIK